MPQDNKIADVERWRAEILLAEDFREKELGVYKEHKVTKAGENIEYFEKGYSGRYIHDAGADEDNIATTLNLFHALIKNVVPALYYKNPRVLSFPQRRVDETAAPFAAEILNHYYKEINADEENRKCIWDAYNIGLGIYKVGYATKFGADIPDEVTKKKKLKDRVLEQIGLKKEEQEPPIRPEVNKEIIAESPYVQWISPFNFLIDPRASSLKDAMWVAHVVDKTVEDIKKNPKFKNTGQIQGSEGDMVSQSSVQIPITQFEAFRTVKLYEVHYRRDDGFYLLYIVKDGNDFKPLYHEKSIYEMDEWQFGILDFSGHDHKLYKRSEMTKIKNLQDRWTATFDNILEQVDRFVPKIGVDETALASSSKEVLEDGDIGSIIYFNKTPRDAIQEISLTQLKGDMRALSEDIVNIITIQTGLTKAQLTGVATGETATAETIAQGGQTLRISDMTSEIARWGDAQATKLWKIVRQFADLPTLELITGESGVDQQTGLVRFSWLPEITEEIDERLRFGNFRFNTEVASTQKANTALIMKRIEDLLNILARTDVIALMQQQGKKVDLAEILRMLLRQMPEVVKDVGKIIQDITQDTNGTLTPEMLLGQLAGTGPGGPTTGSQNNALAAQLGSSPSQQGLQQQAAQQ
jgi:hypothetical protein